MNLLNQCVMYAEDLSKAGLSEWSLCGSVSLWVNSRIRYEKDPDGRRDVWSTPWETLKRGYGDCEDMAALKVWMLILAGVDQSRLRIATNPGHAFAIMRGVEKRFCFFGRKKRVCVVMDNQDHNAICTYRNSGYRVPIIEPYTFAEYLEIANNDEVM